jgi:hypothetical protein
MEIKILFNATNSRTKYLNDKILFETKRRQIVEKKKKIDVNFQR